MPFFKFERHEVTGVTILVACICFLSSLVLFFRRSEQPQYAQRLNEQYSRYDDTLKLRLFDPNEVEYEELRQMGLSRQVAVSIVRMKALGKVFHIKEDLALCYGMNDSIYERIKPYIVIGEKYQFKPFKDTIYPPRYAPHRPARPKKAIESCRPFLIDTVSEAYLVAIGAFTPRQAQVFVRWHKQSTMLCIEDLKRCYVVSDSIAEALAPYVLFPKQEVEEHQPLPSPWEEPIEINSADSAALRRIVGIGEKTVCRIMEYRDRLGGFYKKEQIGEVPGITKENLEKILQQISCDCCVIKKININFAPRDELARHPYIAPHIQRKLLKHRQLKGGWSNTQELIDDHILTQEEAERLSAYMDFGS